MNNQEAFNKMVQHLRAQKVKSLASDGTCLYRGPNGLKCAVGALIPDTEYSEEFETVPASTVSETLQCLSGIDYWLLDTMQEVHDLAAIQDWEDRFKDIAEEFNLDLPQQ